MVSLAAAPHRRPNAPVLGISVIAALGAVAAVLAVAFVWRSPTVDGPKTVAIVKGLLVASYVAVGAYTWRRRPHDRLGPLVAGVGFLYALTALTGATRPLAFTVGRSAVAVLTAYFVYLFLCFPRDRISAVAERRYALGFGAATAAAWVVVLAAARVVPRGGAFSDCARNCPENPLQFVETSSHVTRAIDLGANIVTGLGLAGAIVLLLRQAASPAHLRRRAIVPLLLAAVTFSAAFATYSVLSQAGVTGHTAVLRVITAVGAFAIPLALLVGQIRGRLFAATNLWRVLASTTERRFSPVWVEHVLKSALGDPSFSLGVWEPEHKRYVDSHGQPLSLEGAADGRSVAEIDTEGRPALALLYDPSLDDEPEIIEGLGATAAVLLENDRLVKALEASRARIAGSAARERLRLERDLHDGAQQRLMALQIKLSLARGNTNQPELADQLDELAEDASAAVDELRTLAHGIYPTVLRERGVADAVRAFARATPTPVQVVDRGLGRASSGVEAAIYYCALEAIQNVVKHAGRDATATVMLDHPDGEIEFVISDDGTGFDPTELADGIGLVSMHDRVAAVGGELLLQSSPGAGTIVVGRIPAGGDVVAHSPEGELGP